jgi:hypothetical protein
MVLLSIRDLYDACALDERDLNAIDVLAMSYTMHDYCHAERCVRSSPREHALVLQSGLPGLDSGVGMNNVFPGTYRLHLWNALLPMPPPAPLPIRPAA